LPACDFDALSLSRTRFVPETISTKPNERDRNQTKTQQNQPS
jgi:hypothetical protein